MIVHNGNAFPVSTASLALHQQIAPHAPIANTYMNPYAKLNVEMDFSQSLILSHPFEHVMYAPPVAQPVETQHTANHVYSNSTYGKVCAMSLVQTPHLTHIPHVHNVHLHVQPVHHRLSALGVLLIIHFKIQSVSWSAKGEYLLNRFVILVACIVLFVRTPLAPNAHLPTCFRIALVFRIAHQMLFLLMGKLVSIALLNSQAAQHVTKPIVYLVHKAS